MKKIGWVALILSLLLLGQFLYVEEMTQKGEMEKVRNYYAQWDKYFQYWHTLDSLRIDSLRRAK